jgi:hypothetical protein
MSFNAASPGSGTVKSLQWSLAGIDKLKVKTIQGNQQTTPFGTNPLYEQSVPDKSNVLVDSYNDNKFEEPQSTTPSSPGVKESIVVAITKTLSEIETTSTQTRGAQHTKATLESYQKFLNDNNLEVPLSSPSSSMLLKVSENLGSGADVATSLLDASPQSCSNGKRKCFLEVRSKIANHGALVLRNLFANAMQDADFLRDNVSHCYNSESSLGCGIWRVQLKLMNQEEIGTALDEAVGTTNLTNNDYFRNAFIKLSKPAIDGVKVIVASADVADSGEKAPWIFIVTAYKTSQSVVKLFISFVDDAYKEYTLNILPLFTDLRGTNLKYLNPDESKTGITKSFIGGTPFTVPTRQRFLGSASLDAYVELPLELSSEYAEDLWSEGSSDSRRQIMEFWVDLIQVKVGIKSFDALKAMNTEDIYAKLHPHITANGDCKIPLCSDTLMVLGLQTGFPETSTMTRNVLDDVLGYFVKKGKKDKVAHYFFETEDDKVVRQLKHNTQLPFSKTILFDIMVGTYIYQHSDGFTFTNTATANIASLILGTNLSAPMTMICARAADLSFPASNIEPTLEANLVSAVRAHNSEVLGPVSTYARANNDSNLREEIDKVRGGLLRLAFQDHDYENTMPAIHARKAFLQLVLGLFEGPPTKGQYFTSHNKRNHDAAFDSNSFLTQQNKKAKSGDDKSSKSSSTVTSVNVNSLAIAPVQYKPLTNSDKKTKQDLLKEFIRIFDDPWFVREKGAYKHNISIQQFDEKAKQAMDAWSNPNTPVEQLSQAVFFYRQAKEMFNKRNEKGVLKGLALLFSAKEPWFNDKIENTLELEQAIKEKDKTLEKFLAKMEELISTLGLDLLQGGFDDNTPTADKEALTKCYQGLLNMMSKMETPNSYLEECAKVNVFTSIAVRHTYSNKQEPLLDVFRNSLNISFIQFCFSFISKINEFASNWNKCTTLEDYQNNNFLNYGKTPLKPNATSLRSRQQYVLKFTKPAADAA